MPTPSHPTLRVEICRVRVHLPRILELEQAADADRRFLYGGVPWTCDGFREFLRSGCALVALSRENHVVGFACYSLSQTAVEVAKLVAPQPAVEESLLRALWDLAGKLHRQFVNLPMVLNLTTSPA